MAKGRRILNDNIRKDMKRLLQALANADNPSIDTLEHAEAIAASTLCTSMIAGKSRRRNSMAKYLRDRELFFKEGHPTTIEGDSVLKVGFKRLSEGATIPTKAHATDSGFDLCASEDVIIEPGETKVVPDRKSVV